MAQNRRIKPKAAPAKKAKKARQKINMPWALMLVILVSGVVLGMLISGAQQGDQQFGAGLRALVEAKQNEPTEDEEIAQLIENQSTEKEFEFYELLRDIEKVMPDDLPDSEPVRPAENIDYYLQAASFRKHADAEKLRARLALKGYKSVTQAREVEGKGTFYRVRLGPYGDKRKAKTAKNRLQKVGVRPFIFTVQK